MVEGGGQPTDKNLSVAYNTQILRQALNSFFSRLLGRDDISVIVSMEYGYRNAVKSFLANEKSKLFVDLDAPKCKIEDWFKKLESVNIGSPLHVPINRQKNIFFMIQEMEAWFLKQPQCFEKWAKTNGWTRRNVDEKIEDHSLITKKDIESITKPSVTVANLMRHFFEKKLKGEKRKIAKYGKLTTAPILLDNLNALLLEKQDTELQRFNKNIQTMEICSPNDINP